MSDGWSTVTAHGAETPSPQAIAGGLVVVVVELVVVVVVEGSVVVVDDSVVVVVEAVLVVVLSSVVVVVDVVVVVLIVGSVVVVGAVVVVEVEGGVGSWTTASPAEWSNLSGEARISDPNPAMVLSSSLAPPGLMRIASPSLKPATFWTSKVISPASAGAARKLSPGQSQPSSHSSNDPSGDVGGQVMLPGGSHSSPAVRMLLPHRVETQIESQPSPSIVFPSSHSSSHSTVPFPQTSLAHVGEQPSHAVVFPSSHCSPESRTPSPHAGGLVVVVVLVGSVVVVVVGTVVEVVEVVVVEVVVVVVLVEVVEVVLVG